MQKYKVQNYMNKKTYWIGGKHAVYESLKNPRRKIVQILSTYNLEKVPKTIKNIIVDEKKINKIFSQYKNFVHQNIAAEIETLPKIELKNEVNHIKNIIMLDGITDIGNIGSILRTAVAFNFNSIIVEKKMFNQNNPVIHKNSSGAIENLNIFEVSNLSRALEYLKENNFWSYALDMKGKDCVMDCKQFSEKNIIILGSENNGISKNLKKKADYTVKINISNKIESLNVSVAAAIAMAKINSSKI